MFVRLACLSLAMIFVAPNFARASRAELDARALPHLLAVDPTNAALLPASLGGIPSQVLLDYSSVGEERFALGLVGQGARFAYYLDGESHNLLLGGTGWGITLGIRDNYSSGESQRKYTFSSGTDENQDANENSRRVLRLGVGWQHVFDGDRVLQVGLGGSWFDVVHNASSYSYEDTGLVFSELDWESDPGLGVDVALQTLGLSSGLLLGVRYSYSDMSPRVTSVPPLEFELRERHQAAALDVGWRLAGTPLDDLVVGGSLAWVEDWLPIDSRYDFTVGETQITSYFGAVFLSGEKNVWKGITALGGVVGPITFNRETNERIEYYLGEPRYEYQAEASQGRVEAPQIRLGVTWAWRSLVLTGQLRESINLDNPFARWAATLTY